jgi:DNA-binding PadR family transcriptional regulator
MATTPVTARAALLQVLSVERQGYGYGLNVRIVALTKGEIALGDGSIYRALDGLVADGLATLLDERDDPVARRRYRITRKGLAVAAKHRTAVLSLFRAKSS